MKKTFFIALCCFALAVFADKCEEFRDSMGRLTGTATTDSYGRVTYRDSMGRTVGTATKDSYGRITYRDMCRKCEFYKG